MAVLTDEWGRRVWWPQWACACHNSADRSMCCLLPPISPVCVSLSSAEHKAGFLELTALSLLELFVQDAFVAINRLIPFMNNWDGVKFWIKLIHKSAEGVGGLEPPEECEIKWLGGTQHWEAPKESEKRRGGKGVVWLGTKPAWWSWLRGIRCLYGSVLTFTSRLCSVPSP